MEDKSREKIEAMFDSIAPSYDLLNHLLSLGIDKIWRRKVVSILRKCDVKSILDVAAGTGDLSIAIAKGIEGSKVKSVDISEGMLAIAQKKVTAKGLDDQISIERGDALNLEFKDESFDAFTVGFGVRNFENLEKGVTEMGRVIKKGGIGVVLELSIPTNIILKSLYKLYFFKILPLIGKMKSKSDSAYNYLPSSVAQFPSGEKFVKVMEQCGFHSVITRSLCGGIATIYIGRR